MDLKTVDELLTTTRSVRRRLDCSRPVPPAVLQQCIDIALQAPTGSNSQGWSFVVVTDAQKRATIAKFYKDAFDAYRRMPDARPQLQEGDPRYHQTLRIIDSAQYLADHLHEVPVLVLACIEGRIENAGVLAQASVYGSILPAVWSLMLALRARGIGSAWTTLHLMYEQEVAALLGIPEHVTQAALLPVAYFTGNSFKPARRLPAEQFVHWNVWGKRSAG
jgi:nitroreductase